MLGFKYSSHITELNIKQREMIEKQLLMFYFIAPENQSITFYYPAASYSYPYSPLTSIQLLNGPDSEQEIFLRLFEEQIKQAGAKYKKKLWTKKQDKLLISLRSQNLQWAQISQKIPETNASICKRRHERLQQEDKKWPSAFEEEIKSLFSQKSPKQGDLKRLYESFPDAQGYSLKMIKERYLTYLQEGIEIRPWTVEEDLHLVRMLKKGKRKWKLMAKQMPGRNELHLKNRYYGFLRKIWRKV